MTITGTRASTADYDTDLSGYRYLQLDVENMSQIDAVAQAQPELDILVNNAGIALPSIGLDEWDRTSLRARSTSTSSQASGWRAAVAMH